MSEPVVGLASDLNVIWSQCLDQIDAHLEPPVCSALQDSTPLELQGHRLKIGVPATFSRDFLTKPEHLNRIANILRDQTGQDLHPEFVVWDSRARSAEPGPAPTPRPRNGNGTTTPTEAEGSSLNPEYTFEHFVRGNSNNLAAAAAQAVGDSPARAFNPLFIYGGVGLGKTHLMHAIGNVVLKRDRQKRVVYLSAERFTNEMIDSISEAQMQRFRRMYRNVDVLLVDDIQFLVNKERTQEEFFHTFNELHSNQKQIVISSDRPPKHISTLQDRLRSRFEWGMIADIQPPDLETRMAILRKKAEWSKTPVPNEVTSFIAEKIPSNIRELEGALTRVVAYCSLTGRPVSMAAAAEALQNILRDPTLKILDVGTIKKVVCDYFGISHEELTGRRRDQRVVRPRQIAMFLCKELTDASYPEIGSQFGDKDHTTVMHAHRKVEKNLADHYFKTSVDNLKERLKEFTQ